MVFNEQFVILLLTFAGFGSATVWALAVRGWTLEQRLPLPLRETKPVRWNHWTLLATFAVWSLVDQLVNQIYGIGAESPMLEKVQVLCFAGLLKTFLLIELLAHVGGLRLRTLFPGLRESWNDVKTGVWGLLASLLPVWGVAKLIEPLRTPDNGHPFLQEIRAGVDPATLVWIALAVMVVAPLFEELVFRVILQSWLQDHLSPPVAIVAVAIGFAAIHNTAWPDPLPLFPLALVMGYIYYRRRSYLANVVMHSLFNGMNLMVALSGGD